MSELSWAVVIPAYNAADAIGAVIEGIEKHIPQERILIVDDGSTDKTADIVVSRGVQLLQRNENGGKGLALQDGFSEVLHWDVDWIICLDADGQHDPVKIPDFQQAANRNNFDLIIGNRRGDFSTMPMARRFSNSFSSALISLRTGQKMPDVQCGYRAIKTAFLRRLKIQSKSYDIEVEMIFKTRRLNGRIGWVAIPTIYRGERSFLRKFPETIRFLKALLRSLYE